MMCLDSCWYYIPSNNILNVHTYYCTILLCRSPLKCHFILILIPVLQPNISPFTIYFLQYMFHTILDFILASVYHTYIITMCNPPPPVCLNDMFHYSMMSHPYIILVILCRVHGCALTIVHPVMFTAIYVIQLSIWRTSIY